MNIPFDVTGIEIHTERLRLRPWRPDDLADLYAYASVDGVGQMAGWAPHQSEEESTRILQMFIDGRKTFAIEYQRHVIGSLGIEYYNEKLSPELKDLKGREIGYVLSKEYWGKGMMPEAVKAVIDWMFEHTEADFLTCGYFVWNRQSQRVQEKCGFRFLKYIEFETMTGTKEKTSLNILYRTDWLKNKGAG